MRIALIVCEGVLCLNQHCSLLPIELVMPSLNANQTFSYFANSPQRFACPLEDGQRPVLVSPTPITITIIWRRGSILATFTFVYILIPLILFFEDSRRSE